MVKKEMVEIEEMTHEYLNECVKRLGICLHEHLIPYTMQRDFQKELQEISDSFSIEEEFDCMKYEVDTIAMIMDLHTAIVEKPELLLSEYQIKELKKKDWGDIKYGTFKE